MKIVSDKSTDQALGRAEVRQDILSPRVPCGQSSSLRQKFWYYGTIYFLVSPPERLVKALLIFIIFNSSLSSAVQWGVNGKVFSIGARVFEEGDYPLHQQDGDSRNPRGMRSKGESEKWGRSLRTRCFFLLDILLQAPTLEGPVCLFVCFAYSLFWAHVKDLL